MHRRRQWPKFYLFSIFILFILFSTVLSLSAQGSNDSSAEQAINAAWEKAQTSGIFEYQTLVDQTTYPAPSVRNAGRPLQEDRLGFAGQVNLHEEIFAMTLWQDASFDPANGIEVKVEDGKTYGRSGLNEWEEMGNVTESFAPGGDPFSFLAGMQNVTQGESQTLAFSAHGVDQTFTTYTFTVDGPAVATHIARLVQEQMQQRGELPHSVDLGVSDAYNNLSGQGELWLTAEGLPARLTLDLDFGAQANGERVTALITSDFYNYETELLSATLLNDPEGWLRAQLPTETVRQQLGINIALFLSLASIAAIFVVNRRQRWVQQFTAVFLIGSMIFAPLLQSNEAHAYYENQAAQQAEQEARQAEIDAQNAGYEAIQNDWNPNQKPGASNYSPVVSEQPPNLVAAGSQSPISNLPSVETAAIGDADTDSDNDGVSDEDEDDYWESCAYPVGTTEYTNSEYCEGVADPTDTDGDSLSDGEEVNALGTFPDLADSDLDAIPDNLEIGGFDYNGQTWYLDPLESDTNSDGLTDTQECYVWAASGDEFDETAVCPDTDNDGTPDYWDDDNDGDGVADATDLDPFSKGAETYTNDNPLNLSVAGLQTDKPVFVELQFRPTELDHLTYSGLILDWPTGDYEGQIQRGLDSTFATTTDPDAQSDDDNAANGDIKIYPMLEITIPYSDGHYGNLPVLGTAPSTRDLNDTITDWLDETELDPYSISVSDVDETSGDLSVYVPLSTVEGAEGDSTVAFGAQMLYYPSQGTNGIADWGSDHEYRIYWVVQMITDKCIDDSEDNTTCTREDELSIIQMYEESWELTGLNVTEDHGLDMAMLYEDPTQDDDLELDDQLWTYGYNLMNTFIAGLDCDSVDANGDCVGDGNRDVTLANLQTKMDEWIGTPADNYTEVVQNSYLHQDYFSYSVMTEASEILSDTFASYADVTYPSILFLSESTTRGSSLDGLATIGTGTVAFDLTAEESMMTGSLTLATYESDNSNGWQQVDYDKYMTYLVEKFEEIDYFQAEDDSEESQDVADGKIIYAQIYYTTLANGSATIVEFDEDAFYMPEDYGALNDYILTDIADLLIGSKGVKSIVGAVGTSLTGKNFFSALTDRFTTYDYAIEGYKTQGGYTGTQKLFNSNNSYLTKITRTSASTIVRLGYGLMIAGAIFFAAGYALSATGSSSLGGVSLATIGVVLLSISAVVLTGLEMAVMVAKFQLLNTLVGHDSIKYKANTVLKNSYRTGAAVFYVFQLVAIWGMFTYQLSQQNWQTNSAAFHFQLAYAIASTIVATILFIISLWVPVGTFITTFFFLVEGILTLIGLIFDDVNTISEEVSEALVNAMYDVDLMIANFEDTERLEIDTDYDLIDAEEGYTINNGLTFTMSVTNTIWGTEDTSKVNDNTFDYALQEDANDIHDGLARRQMQGEWTIIPDYGTFYFGNIQLLYDGLRMEDTVTMTLPFSEAGTGINKTIPTRYLSEGYVLAYQGCWKVGGHEYNCDWYDYKGTNHLVEIDYLTFDILPATLKEFVELDWFSHGAEFTFGDQTDQDGDSLLSIDMGGTDPDDTNPDTDGDGLTDYYEISNGYDPEDADMDDDGLTDGEEALTYYTDVDDADTDGDGLTDYFELIEGWLVSYEDEHGATQVTRIWSNPFYTDLDDDSLSDLQEFIFGFHPEVSTDPSVIADIVEFENITVNEEGTPVLMLRGEESDGATVFVDSSGERNDATCELGSSSCPTAGTTGRYGDGIVFDGADYLTVADSELLDLTQDATIALWIKPDNWYNGAHTPFVSKGDQGNGTSSYYFGKWFDGDQALKLSYYNGSWQDVIDNSGTTFTNDVWTHVALVVDGQNNLVRFYKDGVQLSEQSHDFSAHPFLLNDDPLTIGSYLNSGDAVYDGMMDEIVVLDRVLDRDGIEELMNGRYNPNDLIVQPGAELTYQATVTNTSTTQEINGFMLAESSYISPSIGFPYTMLSFDNESRRYVYFDDQNDHYDGAYCYDDGTCPTVSGGALEFDGIDDALQIDAIFNTQHINRHDYQGHSLFGLNLRVDSLPPAGETIDIIKTDSTDEGTINLTLDSDGFFELSFIGANEVINTGVGSNTYSVAADLGTSIYFLLEITHGSGVNEEYIQTSFEINGNRFSENLDPTSDDFWIEKTRLGPGTIGEGLDGAINHIIYYSDDAPANNTRRQLSYNFNQAPAYETRFIDLTNDGGRGACVTDSTCPASVTGVFGEAADFDGDDYVTMESVDLTSDNYTIGMWVKTTEDDAGILLHAYDADSDSLRTSIRVTGGVIEYTDNGIGLIRKGLVDDGNWHYVTAIRDDNAGTMSLYIDGTLIDSVNGTGNKSSTVNLFIGRQDSDIFPVYYTGQMDEFIILPVAVDPTAIPALMNSRWPMIDIPDDFVTLNAAAQTGVTIEGTALVDETAVSSQHLIQQEVEAALNLQTNIDIPVVDDNSTDLTLFFPFEEAPGATAATNLITYTYSSNGGPDTEIPFNCAGSTCPTFGMRGRVDRAAYFDGNDDILRPYVDQYYHHQYLFDIQHQSSVSVWVRGTHGTILDACHDSKCSSGFLLEFDQLRLFSSATAAPHILSFDTPENEWTHIVITLDEDTQNAKVYLNGQELIDDTFSADIDLHASHVLAIGGREHGGSLYEGLMDDLRFYNEKVLSAPEVLALYEQSAPIFRFEFDEESNATRFVDATEHNYIGIPSIYEPYTTTESAEIQYQPNPIPGTDGQIGNTALFDGQGTIEISDTDVLNLADADFTIMAWVKTEATGVGILAKNNDNEDWESGEKAFYIDHNGYPSFVGYGNAYIQGSVPVNDNLWHHVAVVWDYDGSGTGGTGYMIVDGFDVTDRDDYAANRTDIAGDTLKIGAPNGPTNEVPNIFDGQLDELSAYQRALSESEIYSIYLREIRWYRDHGASSVVIDADDPTVELLTTAQYYDNEYIQLVANVDDATSGVTLVEFGLKTPADSDFVWETAVTCADSNATRCPYFMPSAEGTYEFQFRVVDGVGHETTSQVYSLYVDDTAPVISSGYVGGLETAVSNSDDGLNFTINLNGAISDTASGIDTDSVTINLRDATGEVVGTPTQKATVPGDGTWSATYDITDQHLVGTFTIEVTAQDEVGNSTTVNVGSITLDTRPTTAVLHDDALATGVISNTTSISGVVSEQPGWAPLVNLHFEEETGATTFYDYSGNDYHATCSTRDPKNGNNDTCPIISSDGRFGQALYFEDHNSSVLDYIRIPEPFDPLTDTFSVSLWIYMETDGVVSHDILAQENNVHRWLNVNANDKLQSTINGTSHFGTTTVSQNSWHHVALTFDGTTVTGYLNGQMEYSGDVTPTEGSGDLIFGVHHALIYFPFYGYMDEIALYKRVLTEGEIEDLAEGNVTGVASVEVALEPIASGTLSNTTPINEREGDVSWLPATVNSSGNRGVQLAAIAATNSGSASWNYALPNGIEGFYQMHLRSSDAHGNAETAETVWRGLIDDVAPIIVGSGQHVGSVHAAETEYSFTITDFLIAGDNLTQPCAVDDLVSLTYSDTSLPQDSGAYEVTATCRVDGHETSRDITACDVAGNCTTETILPTANDSANLTIDTPADNSAYLQNESITFSGGAYDPTSISSITLYADSVEIGTPSFSGNDVTWSLDWSTAVTGTYLIEAVMVGATGTYTDSIHVVINQDPFDDLYVIVAGTGSGSVSSEPVGINCETDCDESYPYTSVVTLTAAADLDSTFTAWDGACTGTGDCVVTMNDTRTVTATFALNSYELLVTKAGDGAGTVSSDPAGISCGADCAETLDHGTVVTLTAVVDTGSTFAGWEGACTGMDDCLITMSETEAVTATFTLNQYDLNVTVDGNGSGTISSDPLGISCPSDCSETLDYGTAVTLTASYDPAASALVWGGACSAAAGDTCVVTVDLVNEVTATFTLDQYSLGVLTEGNGAGSIASDPVGIDCQTDGGQCTHAFDHGTAVTLTAVADTGSTFMGWSGICSGTDDCALTMDSTKNVTATFTLDQHPLNVTIDGTGRGSVTSTPSGIDCEDDCSELFDYGTVVTLTAVADPGTTFSGWSGSCTNNTGNCVVTIDEAENVSATFTLDQHELDVSLDGTGNGSVASTPSGINCEDDCSEIFDYGTVVTLTAIAEIGSTFTGWSGVCTGSDNCVVTMDSAKNVTATFTLDQHELDVSLDGTGNGSVTSTPSGIDCGVDCAEMFDYGTVVTLTAVAESGSTFTGWSGACADTDSCVVTMTQAQSVTASFTLEDTDYFIFLPMVIRP